MLATLQIMPDRWESTDQSYGSFCFPITPLNDDGLIQNDVWVGFVAL